MRSYRILVFCIDIGCGFTFVLCEMCACKIARLCCLSFESRTGTSFDGSQLAHTPDTHTHTNTPLLELSGTLLERCLNKYFDRCHSSVLCAIHIPIHVTTKLRRVLTKICFQLCGISGQVDAHLHTHHRWGQSDKSTSRISHNKIAHSVVQAHRSKLRTGAHLHTHHRWGQSNGCTSRTLHNKIARSVVLTTQEQFTNWLTPTCTRTTGEVRTMGALHA